MKTTSIRKSIPAGTSAASPVRVNIVIPGQVLKHLWASQSKAETATVYAGFRVLSNGRQIFPSNGSGASSGEDLFSPLPCVPGPLDVDILETLDGPPANVTVEFFNLDVAAILASVILFSDGKPEKRQIEKIIPSDSVSNGK